MATRLVRGSGAAFKTLKESRRNNTELFVKKISWVTGASELKNHFSKFGKIKNITLSFDLRTGLHKGFAFISFENNDFYEKFKKFEGKHIIDDEEVICSLANEDKSILLNGGNSTQFDRESGSEMDISKRIFNSEVGTVKFNRIEENTEKQINRKINSKIISKNSISFQNSEKRTNEINLQHSQQKVEDLQRRLPKKDLLEKAVSNKPDLVAENEGDNQMYKKTYTNISGSKDLDVGTVRNGFNGRRYSPNRRFRAPITGTTQQRFLGKTSDTSN